MKQYKVSNLCTAYTLFIRSLSLLLCWCFVVLPINGHSSIAWSQSYIPNTTVEQSLAAEGSNGSEALQSSNSDFLFSEEGLDLAPQHRGLWQQMQEFRKRVYGDLQEFEKSHQWIEDNDFFRANIFTRIGIRLGNNALFNRSGKFNFDDDASNEQGWSLFTFLRIHYARADELGQENYLIPFSHPEVQAIFNQANSIKNRVESELRRPNLSQRQKEALILAYSALVDFVGQDVVMLFSHEPDIEEQRKQALENLRIVFSRHWRFEYWQEALSEAGAILTPHHEMSHLQYLELDTVVKIDRSIQALTMFPFQPYYMRAVRLMVLSDMLARLSMYKQILKDDQSVELPQSCGDDINFTLPESLQFDMMNDAERSQLMDTILSRNGLLTTTYEQEFSHLNEYIDRFILNYHSPQLDRGGFFESRPFERYLSSLYVEKHHAIPYTDDAFLDPIGLYSGALQAPMIDNSRDLSVVLGGIVGQFLRKEFRSHRFSFIEFSSNERTQALDLPSPGSSPLPYLGQLNAAIFQNAKDNRQEFQQELTLLVEKMLTSPDPNVWDDEGHAINTFLQEKLEEQNLSSWDWEFLLSEEQVRELENNILEIKQMPPLHSPESWRRWAFEKLYDFADKVASQSYDWSEEQHFYPLSALITACQRNPGIEICRDAGVEEVGMVMARVDNQELMPSAVKIAENMKDTLQSYAYRGDYYPLVEQDKNRWQESYKFFQELWLHLRNFQSFHGIEFLEGTEVSEIDYLYAVAQNDSAAHLRISYLVYQKYADQYMPQTQKSIERLFSKLKLDQPLHPYWANEVLSSKEQKFMWAEVKRQETENGLYLLNRSLDGTEDQQFYHLFSWLHVNPMFDEKVVDQALEHISYNVDVSDVNNDIQHARRVLGEGNVSLLKDIYENPGDIENNIQRVRQLQLSKGLDTEFATKDYIHQWDINMRAPIYYHALKEASYLRRGDIHEQIQEICSINEFSDNHRQDLRRLHSMSVGMQRKAMEVFNMPLPKTVEKGITRWISDDRQSFFWSIGAGVLLVTGSIATTALGAPIVGLVLGASAIGFNLMSARTDLRQFFNSKKWIDQARELEDLGYTNAEQVQGNFMRTPLLAVMSMLFTIPDIGLMRVSAKMVSQMNLELYLKSFFRKGTRATRQLMTRYSAKVLALENIAEKILRKGAHQKIKEGKRAVLRNVTEDFSNRALSTGTLRESISNIDLRTARVVSDLYHNNVDDFARGFFRQYGNRAVKKIYRKDFLRNQRKYRKVVQQLQGIDLSGQPTRHQRHLIRKKMILESKKFELESKVTALRSMQNLSDSLFEASARKMPLDEFLRQNMEDLGKAIPFMRRRLRDYPSMIVQGINVNRATRVPGVGALSSRVSWIGSDFTMVRKLFLARNQLVTKEVMQRAASELGVERIMAHNSYYTLRKAFHGLQQSANDLIKTNPDQALVFFEKAYDVEGTILRTFKSQMQKKKNWSRVAHKFNNWNVDTMREVFRQGTDTDFITLFNSVDPQRLFRVEALPQLAHETALSLGRQMEALKIANPAQAVDNLLPRYMKALEILSINKNFQLMEHLF